ncbi:MAG: phytanoyl-CoA dioxygenase family protein [Colwellia sp.]
MSLYQINLSQKEQLTKKGFTLLSAALPKKLLDRWRDLALKLESEALSAYHKSKATHGACIIQDPIGPRLMRYDDVLNVDPEAVLDLLSCPAMMAIARELCGRGAIPLQLDILYKHQHPHPVILWHQGAQHPRGYPYLNIGIYLDNADEGNGCLKYVPGTQHELQKIGELSKNHGWNIPGTVEQPAQAGDILVQDTMVLHGSAPKSSHGVRRTIYVEIRPVEGVKESSTQSEFWIELRKRWMALVVKRSDKTDWPQDWKKDLPSNLRNLKEEVEDIVAYWEPPLPAVYHNESINTENYPVPADMKDAYGDTT